MPAETIRSEITRYKELFRDKYNANHALKSPPHITLIPPFRCAAAREQSVIHALDEFSQSVIPFPVILENFNAFIPRVIYVDVKTNTDLEDLFRRLNDFTTEHRNLFGGMKKDGRFSPHVTLAFRDLKKEDFRKAWEEFRHKKIKFDFRADGITLFKHNGKYWEIRHTSAFAGL